jgi:hypothetical protein
MINLFSEENVTFNSRIFGTIFIILSGILLYLDKILIFFNISSDVTFGYSNFSNFIWVFTQSLAPILMIIGMYFKPFKSSFLIATYCYSLQIVWIFSSQHSDNYLSHIYALGISLIVILIIFIITISLKKFRKNENLKTELLEEIIKIDDELISNKNAKDN